MSHLQFLKSGAAKWQVWLNEIVNSTHIEESVQRIYIDTAKNDH